MIADVLHVLEEAVLWLLRTSWQAGLLAGIILLLRAALGLRLHPIWRHFLWLLLIVRLLLPGLPESRYSVNEAVRFPMEAMMTPSTVKIATSPTPAPTAEPPVAKNRLTWKAWLVLGWVVGVVGMAVRVIRSYQCFRRRLRDDEEVTDPDLLALARECAAEMRVKRLPVIMKTRAVATPALFGLVRPRLLLPETLALHRAELRMVLLHEFAHLRRRDVAVNTLSILLQLAHWFNPLLWLAFRAMRDDRELATDALVLSRENNHRLYGETLLRLVESAAPEARPAIGMLDRTRHLKERLRHIRHAAPVGRRGMLLGGALLLLLSFTALTREAGTPQRNPELVRAHQSMQAGLLLSAKEAEALEAQIAKAPDAPENVASCQKLISYYTMRLGDPGSLARQTELILWMIRHHPADPFMRSLGHIARTPEPKRYAQAAALWEEQLRANPTNPQILRNAAAFYNFSDKARAEALLKEGRRLRPDNPEWITELASFYGRDKRPESKQRSLELWEEAVAAEPMAEKRFFYQDRRALAALHAGKAELAKSYARELLEMAETPAGRPNYGNAIFTGHFILGQLAFQSGDLEEAKRQLLASGKTPGSEVLNSFGPDLSLASSLSAAGASETVLAFLDDVAKFRKVIDLPKPIALAMKAAGDLDESAWRERLRQAAREGKPFPSENERWAAAKPPQK